MSCQEQTDSLLVIIRKHTRISASQTPKAKSGIPEHKNGKNI